MNMNVDEKISIIVPVFNASQFIEECVLSLEKQNYPNFEIILVNDGSEDDSLIICQKLASLYSNIVIIDQKNQGVSDARKNGVLRASGKWVVFVDSDDTVNADLLTSLQSYSANVDVVFAPLYLKHLLNKDQNYNSEEYLSLLIRRRICLGPVCKLIKKELFSTSLFNVPVCLRKGEDWVMNVRIAQKIKCARECPKFMYNYRQHEKSLVHTNRSTIKLTCLEINAVLASLSKDQRKRMWIEILKMRILMWKYYFMCKLSIRTRIKKKLMGKIKKENFSI